MTMLRARPMPGGPLAVDLLNTTWRDNRGAVEWLDTNEAVAAFSASWGHAVAAADTEAVRLSLLDARRLAHRLLDGSADTASREGALIGEVNAVLSSARAVVETTADGPTVVVTGDDQNALAIEAIVSAIELRRERPDRVRCCEHEKCVLWFLDTSKSGRRRWCSMETCGNRAKAQRHYKRSTQSES